MATASPVFGLVLLLFVVTSFVWPASANKGMRFFNGKGEDVTTVDKVDYGPTPDVVHRIEDEGEIYKLRMKFDVVAVLVVQEYDCAQCADAHRQFSASAEAVAQDASGVVPDVGKTIAFALIDAEQQADEFASMMGDDPDFHWFVPSVIIFKREHQLKLKRPPVMFNVNEHLARDLPKFLLRYAGPDFARVQSERALLARVTAEATDGVSFGWWGAEVPRAVQRIAELERFNVLFHHLPEPSADAGDGNAEHARLVKRFNPTKASLVAYRFKQRGDAALARAMSNDEAFERVTVVPLDTSSAEAASRSDRLYELVQRFIDEEKTHRPGHQYDLIHKFAIFDVETPAECNQTGDSVRKAAVGDSVVLRIVGRVLETDVAFLTQDRTAAVVGDPASRKDLPPAVLRRVLPGMCRGATRHVVIPAGKAYARAEDFPPLLSMEHRAIVEVTLLGWEEDGTVSDAPSDLPAEL